ncbi:MAG: hypothetical protein NVV57_03750 [Demequina sp.]|nr:hypothetical protein [Demequina sp.]
MAGAASGGIDRRRVLAGIAWTTPAIVLAVSVPQAAASEVSSCAAFLQIGGTFSSKWHANFWDNDLGQSVPAIFNQYNFQYQSIGSCDLSNVFLTGFTMTISQQVGTLPQLPRWGLLSNSEEIPPDAPYEIATPLAVNAGVATLTLKYIGPNLSLYKGGTTVAVDADRRHLQGGHPVLRDDPSDVLGHHVLPIHPDGDRGQRRRAYWLGRRAVAPVWCLLPYGRSRLRRLGAVAPA